MRYRAWFDDGIAESEIRSPESRADVARTLVVWTDRTIVEAATVVHVESDDGAMTEHLVAGLLASE